MELAKEITEIYEDLALRTGELITRYEKGSVRYWNLVKRLAKCEKERDEERRAKEQAEFFLVTELMLVFKQVTIVLQI